MNESIPRDLRKLNEIEQEVSQFFNTITESVKLTQKAISSLDHKLALQVLEQEEDFNITKFEMHEHIIEYIALFSPMSINLRKSVAMLQIITDLERITDHSKKITREVIVGLELSTGSTNNIVKMFKHVLAMIELSKESFENTSTENKNEIIKLDRKIQKLFTHELDKADERNKNYSNYLILKNIERIGDSVKNVFEQIYYIKRGKFIEL